MRFECRSVIPQKPIILLKLSYECQLSYKIIKALLSESSWELL